MYKKDGAALACGGPAKHKNICKNYNSSFHALRQPFSGSARLGLT
jgi:hypothetical protein